MRKTMPKLTSCEINARVLMPKLPRISANMNIVYAPPFLAARRGQPCYSRASAGYPHLTTQAILFAAQYEGDNQGINSDSFGECQTNEHVDTDQRLCFMIATNGAECLPCGETDTNARADGPQTDGERYCERID